VVEILTNLNLAPSLQNLGNEELNLVILSVGTALKQKEFHCCQWRGDG